MSKKGCFGENNGKKVRNTALNPFFLKKDFIYLFIRDREREREREREAETQAEGEAGSMQEA